MAQGSDEKTWKDYYLSNTQCLHFIVIIMQQIHDSILMFFIPALFQAFTGSFLNLNILMKSNYWFIPKSKHFNEKQLLILHKHIMHMYLSLHSVHVIVCIPCTFHS